MIKQVFIMMFLVAAITFPIFALDVNCDVSENRAIRAATHFRSVDFADATTIAWAVGFEGRIMKTSDGGVHWERQESNTVHRLYCVHALNKMFVSTCGSKGTVLVTSDGGNQWELRKVPSPKRLVAIYFINPNIGWTAGDDGLVFFTSNGGKNWEQQQTGTFSGVRCLWFKDEKNGYLTGYAGNGMKTEDGGQNWVSLETPPNVNLYGADFSADGNEIYLTGSFGVVIRSFDGGANWAFMKNVTTNFLRDIVMENDFGIAVGYGVILRYDNESDQWVKIKSTPGNHLQSVDFGSNGKGIAVGRSGAVFISSDNGKNWKFLDDLYSPTLYDVDFDSNGCGIAVGSNGNVLMTDDGGLNWTHQWSGNRSALKCVSAVAPKTFLVFGDGKFAAKTINGGRSWQRIHLGKKVVNDSICTDTGRCWVCGENGFLAYTDNQGKNWKNVSLSACDHLRKIVFLDNQNGWLVGHSGLVMETRDGGITWLSQYTGIESDITTAFFDNDGRSGAFTSEKFYLASHSFGYNSSWDRLPISECISAVSVDGNVFATMNGGLLNKNFSPISRFNSDVILSIQDASTGYWGVGQFGRIVNIRKGESID